METKTMQHTIEVVDRDGCGRTIEWEPGQTLLDALVENNYSILASCGGTSSCATCHVFLDEAVFEDEDRDDYALELLEGTEHFRERASVLSCQIRFNERIVGTTIGIAPEEF